MNLGRRYFLEYCFNWCLVVLRGEKILKVRLDVRDRNRVLKIKNNNYRVLKYRVCLGREKILLIR